MRKLRLRTRKVVKKCEASEIFCYLQITRAACHSYMAFWWLVDRRFLHQRYRTIFGGRGTADVGVFLAVPAPCRSIWARGQTSTTAETRATKVTVLDP